MLFLVFCFCENNRMRPFQNSFPSRQPKPKHRFSAVFAPNTA
ncbi:PilS cassette [Neisseria meningitidis serogroup B]|uniref:PilS cassette n=1 Tax=Neisseria meningitidis serogroup B TaxID=491 RepID=A0A0H5Q9G5_NEIMI|nr:PilS cassette [Neisseria meningitidis serogroup B]